MTIDRRQILKLTGATVAAASGGFLGAVLNIFRPQAILGKIVGATWTPGPPAGDFEELPASLIKHGLIEFEFPDHEPSFVEGMEAIEGNEFRVQFQDNVEWVFSGYVTNWNVHAFDDERPAELGLTVEIQPTGVRFDDK